MTGVHQGLGRRPGLISAPVRVKARPVERKNGLFMKKVLNVGGGSKKNKILTYFNGWQHDLLDIDPEVNPDVLFDARELWKLPARQYDAIYCSHNLEHYYPHEVENVLKGFKLIIKRNGFVFIRVPNVLAAMKAIVECNVELDTPLYNSPAGPISALDMIYGHRKRFEMNCAQFYIHKTGYSPSLLDKHLRIAGFETVSVIADDINISALAFIDKPTQEHINLLGIEVIEARKMPE